MNNLTVTVSGVRETLKALRQLDPEFRRETIRQIKMKAKPIKTTAEKALPNSIMRNWRDTPATKGRVRGGKGWPPYNQTQARRGIKIQFGGRASPKKTQWSLLKVRQADPAGAIFDMAGRKNFAGNGTVQAMTFMRNLDLASNNRKPSRTIWMSVEKNNAEVVSSVVDALRKAEIHVQTLIVGKS